MVRTLICVAGLSAELCLLQLASGYFSYDDLGNQIKTCGRYMKSKMFSAPPETSDHDVPP